MMEGNSVRHALGLTAREIREDLDVEIYLYKWRGDWGLMNVSEDTAELREVLDRRGWEVFDTEDRRDPEEGPYTTLYVVD